MPFRKLDDPSNEHRRNPGPSNPLTAEAMFAEYGDRVHRFCVRLCGGNAAEAEDLAQDVLLLAWRSRDTFQGRSSPLTYLYRIAVNRRQRVRSQATAAELRDQVGIVANATTDLSEQTAVRLDIEQALAALPDDLRTAFLIVKTEGLTYREAARILEIPRGTVQSRVHDATMRLRASLSETAIRPAVLDPQRISSDTRKENCHAV